jgi:hypothetical protein
MFRLVIFFVIGLPSLLLAQSPAIRILTNQVGYESSKPKRAVVEAEAKLSFPAFQLINDSTGKVVYAGKLAFTGPVDKWKHWLFWTIDFSSYTTTGVYRIKVGAASSQPFTIIKNVL